MASKNFKRRLLSIEQIPVFLYLVKWLWLCALIGALAGSASAIFLILLNWVTTWRESHLWIIALLPVGGLLIGLAYHYWGESVVKGNNLLLEEFHSPKAVIPLRMAPLVLFGTLATHFFGGSAGREGTAVQMGAAISDQFTKYFNLPARDRKILLIAGISAGFASVFGTPLAGAVFALEVFTIGRVRYDAILPSFLAAFFADYITRFWPVTHTHYVIPVVPELTLDKLLWILLTGIFFGLAALLFSRMAHFFASFAKNKISYPPLRPVIGGVVIALVVWCLGTTKYIGLGVPTIVAAFNHSLPPYDFMLKLLLTTFTLGMGFKGGEVTPLFFVGATLGNTLSFFVPLPLALLAGMGFVSVFAGATNTPIACTLMGIELFGNASGLFIGLACVVAYLFSGHTSIYSSQLIGSPKHLLYSRHKQKKLDELNSKKLQKT
ncbi:voltage-gated chloride channel family protein [Adhaeribacter aquaticus]|uniref:voltage-gated chloride channel family protein n=1 Tax=Adhaeribacter aquaticus TaxID=299567 RepID=UPI0003F932DE|nr:voltage-gated chloride channel family protein [Adhaeribacter aquaticus]